MKIIIILVFLFSATTAQARDVQLFNPDLFGQPTSTAVKLLVDKKPGEIEPYMVSTDIKCGKYYAASIFYRGKVTFEEIRTSINKVYKNYEKLSTLKEPVQALWRVKEKQFSISIRQEAEGIFRVTYIHFLPTKEIFKAMMKLEGGDVKAIDAMDEEDCKETAEKSK
jgi:hypothetical protein